MPIHLKVEPELDESSARAAAEQVQNHFRNASRGIGADFSQGLKAGIDDAVRGVSGSFGPLSSQADSVFGKMSSGAGVAALAVGGIGIAAGAALTELYNLGSQWDSIADSITGKTGLVGAELDKITESIKNVAVNSSADIGAIGDVAGQLVGALHLTGKPLEDLTTRITDLNELTGDKLNIRDLGKVFRGFGVDSENAGSALDQLYDTFTNTQIPVSDLIASLKQVGPVARTMGLDIGDTAGLLVTLEEAGLNGETAFKGLQIAMGNLAKKEPGKDPEQAIHDVVAEIDNLITKSDETAAIDMAKSTFGKSWSPMFDAIKNGKLNVDDLNTAVQNTGHTIEGSKKSTDDWAEEFKTMKNELQVELEPAAKTVFSGISNMIEQYLIKPFREANTLFHNVAEGWRGLFGGGPAEPGPGAPGVPGTTPGPGSGGGPALGPPSGGGTPGQNPLDVFAPTGGGGHPGPPQLGGGGSGLGVAGQVNNLPNPADMAAIAKAQSLSGLPYTRGTLDCSGYISQIYSAMTGKPTHFTTTANFAALGFRPGYMPGALNIGVTPLPGDEGHMAGTLPNGVNVESGGGHGVLYGSSTGAQSKQFSQQWYFMPGYAAGGGVTGPGGTDTVPAWLTAGEFVVNKDAAAKYGPFLQGINSGGAAPLADPRGVDPHGGSDGGPSLGPFAPWWDTDWMPPEHPEKVGPSIPGVEGKWWHRGPTGKNKMTPGGHWAPPIGKDRPPLPGDPYPGLIPDDEIKIWGYQTGGFVEPLAYFNDLLQHGDKEPGSDRDRGGQGGGHNYPPSWWPWSKPGKRVDIPPPFWGPMLPPDKWWGPVPGYQTGGLVGPIPPTTNTPPPIPPPPPPPPSGMQPSGMQPEQVAQSIFGGLQQGGGIGGLIGGIGNLALNASQAAQAAGRPDSVQPGMQPKGTAPGSGSQVGGAGPFGAVESAAATAADMFAPGSGAAVQIASQLINRTAKYAGQVASIGIMGAMETFLPGGTPLSDPSKSLLGRVASGIAGGQAAAPNMAAQAKPPQAAPPMPRGQQHLGEGVRAPGPGGPSIVIQNQTIAPPDTGAYEREMSRLYHSQAAGDNSR